MSNEPKETNLFGASVSQKLDIFRYTEQDGERACHIAQAADDARTLEAEVKRLADENDALKEQLTTIRNAVQPQEDGSYYIDVEGEVAETIWNTIPRRIKGEGK